MAHRVVPSTPNDCSKTDSLPGRPLPSADHRPLPCAAPLWPGALGWYRVGGRQGLGDLGVHGSLVIRSAIILTKIRALSSGFWVRLRQVAGK